MPMPIATVAISTFTVTEFLLTLIYGVVIVVGIVCAKLKLYRIEDQRERQRSLGSRTEAHSTPSGAQEACT